MRGNAGHKVRNYMQPRNEAKRNGACIGWQIMETPQGDEYPRTPYQAVQEMGKVRECKEFRRL